MQQHITMPKNVTENKLSTVDSSQLTFLAI